MASDIHPCRDDGVMMVSEVQGVCLVSGQSHISVSLPLVCSVIIISSYQYCS